MAGSNIEVPDGSASENSYLVRYGEDLWHGLSVETQDYCREVWKNKAVAAGCAYCVVMLVPDPLFPSGPQTKPYVLFSARVTVPERKPFKVVITAAVELDDSAKWQDAAFKVSLRRHMLAQVKDVSGKVMLRVHAGGQLLHESILRAV